MPQLAHSSPRGLGDMIEELAELRDKKRQLNQDLKDLDEDYRAVEQEIMDKLDQEGAAFAGGTRHRATISEQVVPNVDDWDSFEEYVRDNDAQYLYEKRVAVKPWRELQESGEPVPGTSPFTRRTLSLRKL